MLAGSGGTITTSGGNNTVITQAVMALQPNFVFIVQH